MMMNNRKFKIKWESIEKNQTLGFKWWGWWVGACKVVRDDIDQNEAVDDDEIGGRSDRL